MDRRPPRSRWQGSLLVLWGVALAAVGCGCQTAAFYGQAVRGQWQILTHQEPIRRLITDRQTKARLKQQLELVLRLRQFARDELKLPVDDQYLNYVDLHRPYVVWNVQATPRFSLQPISWWYPVVGRLDYRGYFSRCGARHEARRLIAKGDDVYVDGVPAYSTLGWFKDPILNTFIYDQEPKLAELLFHELAHHRVFAPGDTDFNEAFAVTVSEQGTRRWLRAEGDTNLCQRYAMMLRRNRQFVHLIMNARARLIKIYGDTLGPEGQISSGPTPSATPRQLQDEKERVFAELRRDYAKLKSQWNGYTGYDNWFDRKLNNAQLNSVATYFDCVPGFEALLRMENGDLEAFYQAASRLAKLPKPERHRRLRRLARRTNPAAPPVNHSPVVPSG